MPLIGSSSNRRKVSSIKVDAKPGRIHVREQAEYFIRGEIDVVFDCHLDAVLFRHLYGFPEHFGQALDLWPAAAGFGTSAGYTTSITFAPILRADHSRDHLQVGSLVRAPPARRMPPSEHTVQVVLVEQVADLRQVRGIQAWK